MTDRELMQQALEALNRSDYLGWQFNIPIIKALRERLAQTEQEPVAWGVFESNLHDMFFTEAEAVEMAQLKGTHAEVKPLYTAQQRPWSGLTDEEIKALVSWWPSYDQMPALMVLAKDIQNSIKEKNT